MIMTSLLLLFTPDYVYHFFSVSHFFFFSVNELCCYNNLFSMKPFCFSVSYAKYWILKS